MTAATNAARAARAHSRARSAVARASRLLVRLALTAGFVLAGWLLATVFASSASASESTDSGDSRGNLLGGLTDTVGNLTDTTSSLTGQTLKTVSSATGDLTKTVTDTVDTTVDTATGVVDKTVGTVTGTVGAVTGTVGDTVDTVTGGAQLPAPIAAEPVATAPASDTQSTTVKKDRASADRPTPSARAAVRSDVPFASGTDAPVSTAPSRSAGGAAASGGSGSGDFQLPLAPVSGAVASAAASDAASKNPVGILPATTSERLRLLGVGAAQQASATAAAAELPRTSPD